MANDTLKKGISLIAFGFLFTLVSINLTLNGAKLNVTPDFIGWILFFVAYDKLGGYVAGKSWLKWTALVLGIVTGAFWVLDIASPGLDLGIVRTIVTVVCAVWSFVLFDVLERIALDHHSAHAGTIRTLKYVNVIAYAVFVVLGLLGGYAGAYIGSGSALAVSGIAAVAGVVALVAAIVTAFVLFRFRKEINEMTDGNPHDEP